jgi:hypothetical protein
MQIQRDRINVATATLQLTKDFDTGEGDLETFISIIKKLNAENKKAGFKKMFNPEEQALISEIYDDLLGDVEMAQGTNCIGDTPLKNTYDNSGY